MSARALVWLVSTVVAMAGPAAAQVVPRNEAAVRAQEQLDHGEVEAAVTTLDRALEQPELSDEQLAELSSLMGLAQLYLGDEARARQAFEKVLQARPDYDVPKSTPPKIRAIYSRIRDDIRQRRVRPVTVSLSPVEGVAGDQPLRVEGHLEDLGLGAKARLFYRRAGAQSFSSVDFRREKGSATEYTATIPAFELPAEAAPYEVDYYVEVADAAQRRLAGRGDSFAPLSFRVAAKPVQGRGGAPSAPWYKSPWVWLGVGVGAAAVATGAVVLATQKQTGTVPIKIQIDGTP